MGPTRSEFKAPKAVKMTPVRNFVTQKIQKAPRVKNLEP